VAEGAFEGGLHFHVAEFGDGEVEVVEGFGALFGVVLEEELGELEAREGDLGAMSDLGADLQSLVIIGASLASFAEEERCRPEKASGTGQCVQMSYAEISKCGECLRQDFDWLFVAD
jgi:hypothetical protein